MKEQILEMLPEDSPAKDPETGVSVIDELRDMRRDFRFLIARIDADVVAFQDLRSSVYLANARRWVK